MFSFFNTLLLSTVLICGPISAASTSPNFIYILVDDLGWANVQFHNDRMITPTLDALLGESLVLNHYYTYKYCSPTRSSFLSGRIPYHVNEENGSSCVPGQGIPLNMTTLSERLVNDCGYYAHQIGKWHAGMYSNLNTPHGRKFNTSLGYLHGAEDHFTQFRSEKDSGQTCQGVDLWDTTQPAYGQNGTYGGYIYQTRAMDVINDHHKNHANVPLFMYIALQDNHSPYEVPEQYIDQFNSSWYQLQRQVAGMSNFFDLNMIANVTNLLKANGMWDNTLLVISADNGGPSGTDDSAANNCPLRGGKYSDFEGGIRVVNMITGGYLPKSQKGKSQNGIMHIADWYATILTLAGADPFDERANRTGFPAVDSINFWDFVSGKNLTSPRTEFVLSSGDNDGAGYMYVHNNTHNPIIYKLLFGTQKPAFWTTYDYPNGTQGLPQSINCGKVSTGGCFFDVTNDLTEHDNKINDPNYSDIIEYMRSRFQELNKTAIAMNRGANEAGPCCAQIATNNEFWGPWVHCDDYETCVYDTTNGLIY